MASMNGLRRSMSETLPEPLLHNRRRVESVSSAILNQDNIDTDDLPVTSFQCEPFHSAEREERMPCTLTITPLTVTPLTVTADIGLEKASEHIGHSITTGAEHIGHSITSGAEHIGNAITSVGNNLERAIVTSVNESCHTLTANVDRCCDVLTNSVRDGCNCVRRIAEYILGAFIAYLVFMWITMPKK